MLRIVRGEHPRPEEHPTLDEADLLWPLMRRCWARKPPMRPIMGDVKIEVSVLDWDMGSLRTRQNDLVLI